MADNDILNDWENFLGLKRNEDNENLKIKRVVKRNGQIEIYDRQKIYNESIPVH